MGICLWKNKTKNAGILSQKSEFCATQLMQRWTIIGKTLLEGGHLPQNSVHQT